ncbi:hypothetical protein [Kitasatospora sp. NPDC097691]|uniref:hypothetical protein n=1 Tax=Kitasatospora sp. NPDC097691 TaxID=3157231 RepID=UPI003322F1F7
MLARRDYPELRFLQGAMTDLDLPDGTLGGEPDGHLLLGGHVGDEHQRRASAHGHPVSSSSRLVPADRLADRPADRLVELSAELSAEAGFTVTTRLEQLRPDHPGRGYVSLSAHR